MPNPIQPASYNVALAAYGMSGRIFHAPFLAAHPHLKLAAILERSKQEAAERYPEVAIVRRYEQLLEDPGIDLVVVNTPNTLHYDMARAALEAGKHVVLEKPFTNTVAEGQELIALAKSRGLMLSVYHNRRLQSGFKTARQLLQKQTLGDLASYRISVDRYRPEPGPKKWKEQSNPGAGLLYDIGSHLLDEALCLFGRPHSLFADLQVARRSGEVCDQFEIRLYYPQHRALLSATLLAREPGPAYVIHGSKGSYVKQEQDLQEARLADGADPTLPRWAEEPPESWGLLHNEQGRTPYPTLAGSYEDYYENIYRHLSQGQPLLVAPEQALEVIELIELAQRSQREGRTITL